MADFHFQHNFLYFIFNVSELFFVRIIRIVRNNIVMHQLDGREIRIVFQ